jgi:hypothetical protein
VDEATVRRDRDSSNDEAEVDGPAGGEDQETSDSSNDEQGLDAIVEEGRALTDLQRKRAERLLEMWEGAGAWTTRQIR